MTLFEDKSAPIAASPLYRGAGQPARRALGIAEIETREGRVPVRTQEIGASPFATLLTLSRADRPDLPEVLVVPPLSGHFAVLLRDLIAGLVERYRTSLIDWTNIRHVLAEAGAFGLAQNIGAVSAALTRLAPGAGLIGVCQGGIPAMAAAAEAAAGRSGAPAPRALALIAAPVDPMAAPTGVVEVLRRQPPGWFGSGPISTVHRPYLGEGRRVYPAHLQLGGLSSYMLRRQLVGGEMREKSLADDGLDPLRFPFTDLFTSIMDLDADQFVENIEALFLRRDAVEGSIAGPDGPVDLRALAKTPMLTIEGERDDIAAPGQTAAALALSPPDGAIPRRRLIAEGTGHFGLFHGRRCRSLVLPVLTSHLG